MPHYQRDTQCRHEKCKRNDSYYLTTACRRYSIDELNSGACPDYITPAVLTDFSKELSEEPHDDSFPSSEESMSFAIQKACNEMAEFLISKNESYGNSIADPIKIFSKTDTLEQINVRLDDKFSRIIRGKEYPGDNDLKDISGYYILKRAVEIHEEK